MRKGTIIAAVMALLIAGAIVFMGADRIGALDRGATETTSAHPLQPEQKFANDEPESKPAGSEGVATDSTGDQTGITEKNLGGPLVPPVKRVAPKTPPLKSGDKSQKAKP